MTGIVVAHYLPGAARFLLNAHRHAGAVYLRLGSDANLHLGGAFAEPLHILNLVFPILNSHENASRPVRVNALFLLRRGKVPIPNPLPELAGGVVPELRYVQYPAGQLYIPIAFFQLPAGYRVKVGQLFPVLIHVEARIIGHQARQVHDVMPVRAPNVSVPEPVVGYIARIAGQSIPRRDGINFGFANPRVKISQLMAGDLAGLVDANKVNLRPLVAKVIADAG